MAKPAGRCNGLGARRAGIGAAPPRLWQKAGTGGIDADRDMSKAGRKSKRAGYYAEYLAVRLVFGLLGLLTVDAASALGGRLGRTVGPRLRRDAIARRNMQCALPDMTAAEIDAALVQMWDNLGRTFAEYAHLGTLGRALSDPADDRITVVGREYLDTAMAAGSGVVVFGGHFANWELPVLLQATAPVDTVLVYRHQNNPWIDRLLARLRPSTAGKLAPKGAAGARDIIATLRGGGLIGVLIDQKYNEGLAVPFFGRDAMTVTGPAELALRRGAPLIPLRVERLAGARFRITVSPPLAMPAADSGPAGLAVLLRQMNATLEDWIRAVPGQWYWIHQRWPRD
jgi:Kdo2-lipid IVA lauroyltransferase/acyltransferase